MIVDQLDLDGETAGLLSSPEEVAEALSDALVVGVDSETTGLSPRDNKMRLLQLSDGEKSFVIDLWRHKDIEPLREILTDQGTIKVLQNAKFDWQFLKWHYDIEVSPLFDTMIAAHLLGNQGSAGLESLARNFLDVELPKDEQRSNWKGDLSPSQIRYAAKDAEILLPLRRALATKLEEEGLIRVAKVEFACLPVIAQMELNGMKLDLDQIEKLRIIAEAEKRNAHLAFEEYLPDEPQQLALGDFDPQPRVNLGSPKQVTEVFAKLGVVMDGTGVDVLKKCSHPAAKVLLEHRKHKKRLDAFLDPLPKLVHPVTGRIHPTFNQARVVTGRISHCVSGDTLLETSRGTFRFDEYEPREGDKVVSHRGRECRVLDKLYKGVDKMYRVCLTNGAEIKCTLAHRILTPSGWTEVGNLNPGNEVVSYVGFKELHDESGEHRQGTESLLVRKEAHHQGHGEDGGNDLPQCSCHCQTESYPGSTQCGVCLEVLSGEVVRGESPVLRKDGGESPQLERQLRGRTWLPDKDVERTEDVCASDSPHGSYGDYELAERFRGSSHRREHEEQRTVESCDGYKRSPQGITRETVEVSEIVHVGAMGVYDIEVEGDHSYASQGFLNHNSKPNVAQIPREQSFRDCFVAEEGNRIVTADFQGQELRILAELSDDEAMKKAFTEGIDLHTFSSSKMYGIAMEDVTKEQRNTGKTCSFALLYGAGPGRIAGLLGVSPNKATELMDAYFDAYPRVRKWMDKVSKEGVRNGYIRTLSGRRIPLTDGDKNRAGREAINYSIQGLAADMTKMALYLTEKKLKVLRDAPTIARNASEGLFEAMLINSVHDELVIECGEDWGDTVEHVVHAAMVEAGELFLKEVPIEAEVEVAKVWKK